MKYPIKSSLFILGLSLFYIFSFSQEKQILKSWIKREIYSLPGNTRIDDTLYTRYSFQKNKVYISFNPGWNDAKQEWSMEASQLRIGFATYTIEEITDSTLIISSPGFRRILLDNEDYLNRKSTNLQKIGEFNNEPVYKANEYITPRYKKEGLREFISQNLEGYNIRKAITFMASFIIKKDGSVDNIQIINGISEGFDAEVIKQLKKTSKDWTPAFHNGEPIQAQMIYTIKYLDSIVK